MANASIDGLVSGLDTTSIISQLMQLERQPQTRLIAKRDEANKIIGLYQAINSTFATLSAAGRSLTQSTDWKIMRASASVPTAVAVTATSAASPGSLSFSVERLAQGGAAASTGTVSSTAAVVASGDFLISKGADRLGIAALGAGAGLTLGAHEIEVTVETSGATQLGGAPLATTDFGAGATLSVRIDGGAQRDFTLTGVLTPAEIVESLQAQAGDDLTVSLGTGGVLSLATTHEGSAASLEVLGGSPVALGLTASTTNGGDGTAVIDGQAVNVTSAGTGISTTLTGANGSMAVTFAGGLRTGSVSATAVSTGNGTLSAVVDAVNRANAGVAAAAVKVGENAYRLQLTSTSTGENTNMTSGMENLTGLGAFASVSEGQNSVIRVGSGAGAYDISSATNTLSEVLPGVTLQLRTASPGTPVTINVEVDGGAVADKVGKLVEAANGALNAIRAQSSYNPDTKKAGLLLSDSTVRALSSQVLRAVSSVVGGTDLGSAGAVGLAVARDGTITFDRAKFLDAYAEDPAAVERLFRPGGSAASASVTFLASSAKTIEGDYDIVLTTPAARAEVTGDVFGAGATLSAGETIDVRIGSVTAGYTAGAGQTLADVAAGLNGAFGSSELALHASVEADQLVIRSVAYGSAVKFEVRTSVVAAGQTGLATVAGAWEEHAGVDVAGTIDGEAAKGAGQVLTAQSGKPGDGLSLTVSATVAGNLGTFSYVPGVAARLHAVAAGAIEFGTGSLTTAISGRQSLVRNIENQISAWDVRLARRELALRRQFSALETSLGNLRNQSNWLAGQLSGLLANSGS